MWPSLKPSQRVAVIGSVAPQSAATVASSGWLPAAAFLNYLAIITAGALGNGATLDAKLQQAQDANGTGAKDIPGKSLVTLSQAANGSNTQSMINLKQEDFDTNNGFAFFQLQVTPSAASQVGATILGLDPVDGPASSSDLASVAQIIG